MITELIISHYRSISDLKITLGKTNLFVGKNGSGKSNIIDALQFLNDVVSEDLDYAFTRRHGSDSVRQWTKFKPHKTTLQLFMKSKSGAGFYKLVLASSKNNFRVVEEEGQWTGSSLYDSDWLFDCSFKRDESGSVVYKKIPVSQMVDDPDEDEEEVTSEGSLTLPSSDCFITYIARNRYSTVNDAFGYILDEMESFSTYSIFPNTVRAPQAISSAHVLEADGKNIASIIRQMSRDNKKNRDRIVRSLKIALPIVTGLLVRSAAGFYAPVLSVKESGGDSHELNMAQISDGTLRLLGMLTAFYQTRAPRKIALEEPEQMIHPALLLIIHDAIADYVNSKDSNQVFLTTHSPYLLDLFEPEQIIAVEFKSGSTLASAITPRQMKMIKEGLVTTGELVTSEGLEVA